MVLIFALFILDRTRFRAFAGVLDVTVGAGYISGGVASSATA